jgi:uncharacterized protein YutD
MLKYDSIDGNWNLSEFSLKDFFKTLLFGESLVFDFLP